jgi:hypothetical protein
MKKFIVLHNPKERSDNSPSGGYVKCFDTLDEVFFFMLENKEDKPQAYKSIEIKLEINNE